MLAARTLPWQDFQERQAPSLQTNGVEASPFLHLHGPYRSGKPLPVRGFFRNFSGLLVFIMSRNSAERRGRAQEEVLDYLHQSGLATSSLFDESTGGIVAAQIHQVQSILHPSPSLDQA